MTIAPATRADLDEVLALLNDAAAWLTSKGLDQWWYGFGPNRIGPMVDRREVWIAREDGQAAGTLTLSVEADPDFWTAQESTERAVYMSKLAIARDKAGAGLGALLLRWAVDRAARDGYAWVRLDAWRTNQELQDYYRRQGWEYLRTVSLPHRRSGALFQCPARPDLLARQAFTLAALLYLGPRPGRRQNAVELSSSRTRLFRH
jgi:GNAT superfamily N-acetyltransferase